MELNYLSDEEKQRTDGRKKMKKNNSEASNKNHPLITNFFKK